MTTIEPTDEMKAAFREAQERRAAELVAEDAPLGGHDILDRGLSAVLAIVERDRNPTRDAYVAAVQALNRHRARAAIHAATLATVLELLDSEPNHKIRDVIRAAIQQGADRIAELNGSPERTSP